MACPRAIVGLTAASCHVPVATISISTRTVKSLQDQLLVASPHLRERNFVKTVVLLLHHSPRQAVGLVLNRPRNVTVKELWKIISKEPCDCTQQVGSGGPLPGPLVALHTNQSLADIDLSHGVYLSARREKLQQLVLQKEGPLKILVGHTGWTAGQLDREIQSGAWLTIPATAELVFHDPISLWEELIKHIGESMLTSALHVRHFPDDPSVN